MFHAAFGLILASLVGVEGTAPTPTKGCATCIEMVTVGPGQFQMGTALEDISSQTSQVPADNGPLGIMYLFGLGERQVAIDFMKAEMPRHTVSINYKFLIGRYPVTVEQFSAFVSETGYQTDPCYIPRAGKTRLPVANSWTSPGYVQDSRDPVVCVSWKDAHAYIDWLNEKAGGEGGLYRLPSEAEWEFAVRGGTETTFWWGDHADGDHMVCGECTSNRPGSARANAHKTTVNVDALPPNAFGLSVFGNAAEIVEDCWHKTYQGAPNDGTAWLTSDCSNHVNRGGSWRGPAWAGRSSTRGSVDGRIAWSDHGFRIARSLNINH